MAKLRRIAVGVGVACCLAAVVSGARSANIGKHVARASSSAVTASQLAALDRSVIEIDEQAALAPEQQSPVSSPGCEALYDGLVPLSGGQITYSGSLKGGWRFLYTGAAYPAQQSRGFVQGSWAGADSPAWLTGQVWLVTPSGESLQLGGATLEEFSPSGCPQLAFPGYASPLGLSYKWSGGFGNADGGLAVAGVCGDVSTSFPYTYGAISVSTRIRITKAYLPDNHNPAVICASAGDYPETAGGLAHTWSNYGNAGGTPGGLIPAYTTVQIACKVAGFKVANGNPWWYQIDEAPWGDREDGAQFYVSADAFYNNGATSGSLRGTPFVDPDVPDCSASTGPPATYAERASIHHAVHTFANYHNASAQGPDIAVGQTVQVSCKVYDPTIASVNPDGYWYRIASSPWNNNYYAPANTFLDGDPPNGPYTHNTDFAVPDCTKSSTGSSTRPSVTVAKGPVAPFGFRYAVTVSGFAANASVAISCRDSVDPSGFFNFDLKTNASGTGFTQKECYSADGPDHWVVADGKYTSNRVQWGAGGSTAPPISGPPSVGSPEAGHLWIVTLGDSYTAGDGAGANYDGRCHLSYNSYAELYMNELRRDGRSVDIWQAACSATRRAK